MLAILAALSIPALAAPTATVFDAPNDLPEAVALPNDEIPGTMTVYVFDRAFGCDDVKNLSKQKKQPNLLMATFDGPATDAEAVEVVLVQSKPKLMVMAASGARLTRMPEAVGGKGTVQLGLDAPGMAGEQVEVERDVSFVLCEAVPDRPSLAELAFVEEEQKVDDFSGPFTAQIPKGWVAGKGPLGDSWGAPDGRTFLDFSTAPAADSLEKAVDNQVKAFDGMGWSSERHRFEAVDGAYVAHWSRRFGEGASQHQLEVYRYNARGAGVKCEVRGDEQTRDEVFAQMEKACLALVFSE